MRSSGHFSLEQCPHVFVWLPCRPVRKVLSSECSHVSRGDGRGQGSSQCGCGRAEGCGISRPHPALCARCSGVGWYSVMAPDLSRPWACWIALKFPHLLPLAPWGLGIGATWAPSFQWMVRDSEVTEELPRAHHCLQEAGTLARVGGDVKWCAKLASCPGVRVAAGRGLEVAQSPFWVSRRVAGGGRLPRHCPGRARGICVLGTLALGSLSKSV